MPDDAGGLSASSEALPKEKRLAKRREFLRVYDAGRKLFSRYNVVFFAANGLPYSRLGVTATKKLGKANLRNRFKRWTREVYRIERESLGIDRRCVDLVVNVKPNAKSQGPRTGDATYNDTKDYAVDVDTVFFLSDGRPTVGAFVDPDDILREVKEANDLRKVIIHTIAIGEFQKDFMKRLAEENGGIFVDLGR